MTQNNRIVLSLCVCVGSGRSAGRAHEEIGGGEEEAEAAGC